MINAAHSVLRSGLVQAGLLALLWSTTATAQTSLGEFGGYPSAWIATSSPSGATWSGYSGMRPTGGYRYASPPVPASPPSSSYAAEAGAIPPSRPTYSYRPGVTNYPSITSGYVAPGPRTMAPGTTTYTPDTAIFGQYRVPGTVSYTPAMPYGGSTYIGPGYRSYVRPSGNFVRQYLR